MKMVRKEVNSMRERTPVNTNRSPGFLSITKARDVLIEKGICSRDGSGDTDVEALFSRIAIVKKELEEIRRNVFEGKELTRDELWSKLNYILNWL